MLADAGPVRSSGALVVATVLANLFVGPYGHAHTTLAGSHRRFAEFTLAPTLTSEYIRTLQLLYPGADHGVCAYCGVFGGRLSFTN